MDVKCFLSCKKLHAQVIIVASLRYTARCQQIQLERGKKHKAIKWGGSGGKGASNLGQLGMANLVQESSASSQSEGAERKQRQP